MHFNGAANHRGLGVGTILIFFTKKFSLILVKLQFECTNNMAEFESCIERLKATLDLGIRDLEV